MGEDGHFASLFPGVTETGTALDPECNRLCVGIDSPQNGHPRMSLTLRALTDATHVYVAITGAEKRAILIAANEAKDTSIPISAMLAQSMTPLEIFWTP